MIAALLSKINRSVTAKFLVTFLLLLIIPLLVTIPLFVNGLHRVLKSKEQDYITEKISYAKTQIDTTFSEMDHIATSLILDYHVTDILSDSSTVPSYDWFTGYKTLNSLLALLTTNANYKYTITVSSHDDNLYHSGANYNSMLKSSDPILLCVRQGNGKPVIFNRMSEGLDENPVITLGRSFYRKGEYLGSILVDVPVSDMDTLLGPFEDNTTQLYILENSSQVVYSSLPPANSHILPELSRALENGSSLVTLENTQYLLFQMPVMTNGLSVVTLVSSDSVFAESSRVIFLFILVFFLIIIAAVIGIFFLTYTFTRNIKALNRAVLHFGEDPGSEIRLPVRCADETGQLTQGVISMSRRIRRLLGQIQQNERNKRILEFNSLQAQINPHMIYNTLNTITYLAQIQNVANIEEISSSFAYLLRSISNQKEFITISQEMEYLRSFVAIKKYNQLCDIEIAFDVEKDAACCRILKLILQPIVENAIIHGFNGQLQNGIICVTVRHHKNTGQDILTIDISDNGSGMTKEQTALILKGEEKSSNTFLRVGIKNIKERLLLQYGDRAVFSIQSSPGQGTTVHLFFPAEETESGEENESILKEELCHDTNSFG